MKNENHVPSTDNAELRASGSPHGVSGPSNDDAPMPDLVQPKK